ncbi:hypothetical protein SAMN06298216_0270 [Spirosomataceae bacterium TFI 002]|nr:hypothetical protein SAMN06298216_0270 [Spirosomataceae bacterium TFI 002]
MQVDRLKILENYVSEEPNDPFNHFALALELTKTDLERAVAKYDYLINHFSAYLPTYYQYGVLLTDQEKYEKAKSVLSQGILLAKEKGEERTKKELEGALQIAKDESEEW